MTALKNISIFKIVIKLIAMSILVSCGCRGYEELTYTIDRTVVFLDDVVSVSYEGPSGDTATMNVVPLMCEEYEVFRDYNDCWVRFSQSCNQVIWTMDDAGHSLEYEITRDVGNVMQFEFTHDKFVGQFPSGEEYAHSMIINGVNYFNVYEFNLTPIQEVGQIKRVFMAADRGIIRYEFLNGDIWDRIPG